MDIFKGTARDYQKYRKRYPSDFLDYIVENFKCKNLLDLGCGTGQITIPLSQHFETVYASDASKEMIEATQKVVDKRGITNVTLKKASAENLDVFDLEKREVSVAVIGNAFLHFNRAETLQNLANYVADDGAVVIVYSGESLRTLNSGWKRLIHEVLGKHQQMKPNSLQKRDSATRPSDEEVISNSPFSNVSRYELDYEINWTIEDILGHLRTTSYASVEVLGDSHSSFEEELKERMVDYLSGNYVTEVAKLFAFICREN